MWPNTFLSPVVLSLVLVKDTLLLKVAVDTNGRVLTVVAIRLTMFEQYVMHGPVRVCNNMDAHTLYMAWHNKLDKQRMPIGARGEL